MIIFFCSAMLADAPEKRRHQREREQYKLASNLVRSINSEDSRNSLNTRLHRKKHRHQVVDNRTGGFKKSSVSRDERRRNRKRDRMVQKCRENNSAACKKLKAFDDQVEAMRANSDLVRSLDRRSSRNGKKKDAGSRKNKKRLSKAERRERRQRRKERKLAKRQRRLLRKQQKQLRKKQARRSRSVSQPQRQAQCLTKYIDTCSWPHCNRSCPKLKNPETGKLWL